MKLPECGRETKWEYDNRFNVQQGLEPDNKLCEKCWIYFGYWLSMCPDCGEMGVMDKVVADELIKASGIDLDVYGKQTAKLVEGLTKKHIDNNL